MIERIKLTEEDFKHDGINARIIIYTREPEQLKQQILDDHKIVERLIKRIKQTDKWREHPAWINKQGISIIQGQFVTNTELHSLLKESKS